MHLRGYQQEYCKRLHCRFVALQSMGPPCCLHVELALDPPGLDPYINKLFQSTQCSTPPRQLRLQAWCLSGSL
eukprot:2272582-Amphidinium_carterae.1